MSNRSKGTGSPRDLRRPSRLAPHRNGKGNRLGRLHRASRSESSHRRHGLRGERHDVTTAILLEARPQPFGGLAWSFRCPVAGRRCRKLWLLPPRAPLRRPSGLAHRLSLAARGTLRAHDHAGAQDPQSPPSLTLVGALVVRPKGMHRQTFERHEAVSDAHLAMLFGLAEVSYPNREPDVDRSVSGMPFLNFFPTGS